MYTVQFRDNPRGWRDCQYGARHRTLEAAINRVTMCDPDKMFGPNARILGTDGVKFEHKDWKKLAEIVSTVVKNGSLEDQLEYNADMLREYYGIGNTYAVALAQMLKDAA